MNVPPSPRILYVHNSADIYGASRSLLRLLPEIRQRGFHPYVLLPESGPRQTRIEALNIPVTVDRSLTVIDRAAFRSLRCLSIGAWFPVSVLRLFRLIRRLQIQLVHTNTGVMPSPALACRLARVPHVWHVRDSFLEFRSLWRIYRRYITRLSHRVLGVSNAIAAQFDGAPNVSVVHNGMPLEEFSEDAAGLGREFRRAHNLGEEPVLGCVGRIKFVRKGQEVLVQALALLKKRGLAAKALIVGAPSSGNEDHLARLRELIRALQIEQDVILTGELENVKPAYAAMDLLVLPSAQPEPFGGVVLEAMAMSRPVIATAIGGSLDQIEDGRTGFLIPPGDPEALADRVGILLHDPKLRRQMGEAGRERLRRCFSIPQMVAKIEAVYRECLSR